MDYGTCISLVALYYRIFILMNQYGYKPVKLLIDPASKLEWTT
jgi:hypothetical protein